MSQIKEVELRIYKDLNTLRTNTVKDSVYFVFNSTTQKVSEIWVTNKNNIPKQVELTGDIVADIQNTDGNLTISGTTINVSNTLLSIINSALQTGDNISSLVNDANYITSSDITTTTILDKIGNGTLIDQQYLPSYVDDVLEFANLASFPTIGVTGKIYIAIDTSKQYRWTDSVYLQITNGLIASTNDVPEGGSNLYFTTARVLSTLLSGLSLATVGAIVSTDSVLTAFGKLQKQITDAISELFWTKTGDNIRNNNVGDVEVKMTIGKKAKFLNNLNSEVASIDHSGNLTANNILTNFVQLLGGARISSSGGGNRFLGFSNTQLSSDLPYVVDFNDVNLQPNDFYIGKVMGVEKFRITRDGKMVIAPATASDEAVNKGQLDSKANIAGQVFAGAISATNLSGNNTGDQSENNVYGFHDFLTTSSNESFALVALNSGTLNANANNVTVNNAGIARVASSTTTNSGFAIRGSGVTRVLKGGEVTNFILNPLTFANTTLRDGIHDATTSTAPNNGVYFEYSGSGVLSIVTANNGTRTTTTVTTLVVNTWYKLRITVNTNATSVLAEVFDNAGTLITSQTVTTNIPDNTRLINRGMIVSNSTTTATNLVDVDFISIKTTLTR